MIGGSGLGTLAAGAGTAGVNNGPFGFTIRGLGTEGGGATPNDGERTTMDPITLPAGDVTTACGVTTTCGSTTACGVTRAGETPITVPAGDVTTTCGATTAGDTPA
jgi:hypothetical protein